MRIGLLQFAPKFGKVDENLRHVVEKISGADVDLYVLPELFSTGYQFVSKEEIEELAEPIPQGRTVEMLSSLASEKKVYIVGGIAEKAPDGYYNSAFLIGPSGYIGHYRKAHLFYEEKLYFKPGNTGFPVFKTDIGNIGLMICFDWIFPEVMRILSLKKAQIVCHPSNLVLPYCQKAMLTRCLENRIFAATANRIGFEERGGKRLIFTGGSQIVDPWGRVVASLGEDEDALCVANVDLNLSMDKSITEMNDIFKDRRVDLYKEILNLY